MNLPVKDPIETVVVTFDFSAIVNIPVSPQVSIIHASGSPDVNPSAMLFGTPSVIGSQVQQSIMGGISNAAYLLECQVSGLGGPFRLSAILPVSAEDPQVAQFRADYPEFSNAKTYPRSQISYWQTVAYSFLNANRWGRQLDIGAALYVAHNICLEARAQADAARGGIPGQQVGPINSKSVDKVSMGYDTGSGIEVGAGHWNLTIYGTRFVRMMKLFGAGPVQIGIGQVPSGNGPAWPGPGSPYSN